MWMLDGLIDAAAVICERFERQQRLERQAAQTRQQQLCDDAAHRPPERGDST